MLHLGTSITHRLAVDTMMTSKQYYCLNRDGCSLSVVNWPLIATETEGKVMSNTWVKLSVARVTRGGRELPILCWRKMMMTLFWLTFNLPPSDGRRVSCRSVAVLSWFLCHVFFVHVKWTDDVIDFASSESLNEHCVCVSVSILKWEESHSHLWEMMHGWGADAALKSGDFKYNNRFLSGCGDTTSVCPILLCIAWF